MFHIAPDHHPAYQSMFYYNQLRYRLMPYIYSLASMTWFKDYTLMRALGWIDEPVVNDISDQYVWSTSVCPVYSTVQAVRSISLNRRMVPPV